MATLKEEALACDYHTKLICIECGNNVKDYRTLRCRTCWLFFFKELSDFKGKLGNLNHKWKDVPSYRTLHHWVHRHKPKTKNCEICNKVKPLQAANISGQYKRDINDYQWLCVKCHVIKDGTINNLNYRRYKNNGK